jgi:N-acylneuraminate cytidylyltransferase
MTIAFIPARGGSKSIPLKNIKHFGGKPLIYWVLKAAEDAGSVDYTVLATDNDKIKETCLGFGFSKLRFYDRSTESATDDASTEMALMEYLKKGNIDQSATVILLQATSPYTTNKDIDSALKLKDEEDYDSVLSCVRIKHFFWNQDGTPKNYNYKNRPRRQEFDGTLQENGAIYISTASQILESHNRLSGNIGIYEMPEYTKLELDEPMDWITGEAILQELKKKSSHE